MKKNNKIKMTKTNRKAKPRKTASRKSSGRQRTRARNPRRRPHFASTVLRASKFPDLLFEIGTEELPAAYLPELIQGLSQAAHGLFTESHLRFSGIESLGGPRRLVLIVRGLEPTQTRPAEEIRGPSRQSAYNEKGQPAQALLGFVRARGGTLKQTRIVSTPKGDYVYLVKPAASASTAAILPSLLARLPQRLHAPKTMRWDESGLRFARPIRWLLAVYGPHIIRVNMGSLASGKRTWVGLPIRPRSITISSAEQYERTIKREGIRLDPLARRQFIEALVAKCAKQAKGAAVPESTAHGLLDEVTHLVERPVALVGSFDPKYLELPREVLLASMAKYQRVFALDSGKSGVVLPKFVAVLDGTPRRPSEARKNIERILNARLADSLLFWKEDHERLPLEKMAGALSGVTFHEKIGSMADKTLHLRALCEPLAEAWGLADTERQQLRRSCQLAKADLVSSMVKEFPTLQGVIGRYYAIDSNEMRPVAAAIEEQYMPSGNRKPKSLVGQALAIVDKFDQLASYFGLGIEPTGDQDPFGLRRAAQGIVEIAWMARRPLPIDPLFRASASMEPFRSAEPKKIAATGARVRRYLLERLYNFEWSRPVPQADTIDAVLASPCGDLVDTMDRIRSLQDLKGDPGLLKAAKVIERTRNILKGASVHQGQVDPRHFQEPLERKLWELYQSSEGQVAQLSGEHAYAKATSFFGEVFYKPLHEFFDQVLVNAPDRNVAQNRLALMRAINTLYTGRIADLSKLSILQTEEP